jgi:hypothetical protein
MRVRLGLLDPSRCRTFRRPPPGDGPPPPPPPDPDPPPPPGPDPEPPPSPSPAELLRRLLRALRRLLGHPVTLLGGGAAALLYLLSG